MQERLGLVMDVLEGRYSVAEASERRNISRKTAYKYLSRYLEEGVAGLEARSRRPHTCPHETSPEIRALLIKEKERRRHWGPKKLVDELAKRHSTLVMPAASTASAILKAQGLVKSRRRKRPPLAPAVWDRQRTQADAPNRVWTIDFKGEFRLGNAQLCYPLTVVDLYSRDPRVIHALPSTQGTPVREVLTRLFERDGLPEVIRSDNGAPFVTNAVGGLSRLAVWWLKLGIRLERNDPGHPEQNGAHERMHRTLKAEATRPPQFDLPRQQTVFDAFQVEYSQERPHEGIGMRRPAELYTASSRSMPVKLPEVTYPGHYDIRIVRQDGCIKWTGQLLFVSEVLAHEPVGIEAVDDGLWALHFGATLLGRFSRQSLHLDGRAERRV